MKERFLYCRKAIAAADDDSSADSAMFSISNFKGAVTPSNAKVALYFKNMHVTKQTLGGGADLITINCTSGQESVLLKNIMEEFYNGSSSLITLDGLTSGATYDIDGVSGVAIISINGDD
jgi:hypothetical protein|tara:strand:+ start:14 stop:373 length:360 start_codon:yes stop_codon:yes gene_type:complete